MDESFLSSDTYFRAREAWSRYREARATLSELGLLRSERTVQSDYGEWLAASLLRLELAKSGVQRGFDATDESGRTYQVKTRLVKGPDQATSFDLKQPSHPFDFLLGVLLTPRGELVGLIRVSVVEALARARVNRGPHRLRWTRNCWHEPWVEVLYRAPDPRAETSALPNPSN